MVTGGSTTASGRTGPSLLHAKMTADNSSTGQRREPRDFVLQRNRNSQAGYRISFVSAVQKNPARIGRQAQDVTHVIREAQAQAYSIVLAVRAVHHDMFLCSCSVLAL